MKELVKNILSVIAFILIIVFVYFGDAFNNISIISIVLALCSFCLVMFLIGYGIYQYIRDFFRKRIREEGNRAFIEEKKRQDILDKYSKGKEE